MKKVVTVHGINTKGQWQQRVEAVLKPHFECLHIQYPHYRHFGASRLVFSLSLLGAGAAAIVALHWETHWLDSRGHALLALGFTLVAARVGAIFHREKALACFQTQLQKGLTPGERPHLIAHSFGTYLTGRALQKWNDARFDRVVLTGTVLSHRFDWKTLISGDRKAVRNVRNELARKDAIAAAAFAAYGTIPEMGYAGFLGFKGDPTIIHDTDGPYQRCSHCEPSREVALVHNVRHDRLRHSDHFLTLAHAESFWLPFFWGIEPCEYQDWLDLCADAAEAEEEEGPTSPTLRRAEEWLSTTPWRWCENRTLLEYMHSLVQQHIANLGTRWQASEIEDLEKGAVRLLWKEVGTARKAGARWREALESSGEHGDWLQTLRSVFSRDPELQRLKIGIQAGPVELARDQEDLIRSLNPRRALSRVIAVQFR